MWQNVRLIVFYHLHFAPFISDCNIFTYSLLFASRADLKTKNLGLGEKISMCKCCMQMGNTDVIVSIFMHFQSSTLWMSFFDWQ